MNQKIIVDAIAKEMTSFDNPNSESAVRIYAEAYLEKLCSSIERLSPPDHCEQLLINWIGGDHAGHLKTALTDLDQPAKLIRCLPPNPRRIKALANILKQWLDIPGVKAIIAGQAGYPHSIYQALIILAYIYQFHSEIFQRWQFSPDLFRLLNKWAAKPWQQLTTDEQDPASASQSGAGNWPAYLQCLELPHRIEDDPNSTVSSTILNSNFPDPYAVNIFWVQPLIVQAQLQVDDINPIMSVITSYKAAPE